MLREQPVRDAVAERVELDTVDDLAENGPIRPRRGAVLVRVEVVRFQDLDLHRNRIAVLQPTPAATDETFPGLRDGAHDQLLQASEVRAAVSVAVRRLGPRLPGRRDPIVRRHRFRDNPPAHGVVGERAKRLRHLAVVPHQVARVLAKGGQIFGRHGVRVAAGAPPALRAAADAGRFVVPLEQLRREPCARAPQRRRRRDDPEGTIKPCLLQGHSQTPLLVEA